MLVRTHPIYMKNNNNSRGLWGSLWPFWSWWFALYCCFGFVDNEILQESFFEQMGNFSSESNALVCCMANIGMEVAPSWWVFFVRGLSDFLGHVTAPPNLLRMLTSPAGVTLKLYSRLARGWFEFAMLTFYADTLWYGWYWLSNYCCFLGPFCRLDPISLRLFSYQHLPRIWFTQEPLLRHLQRLGKDISSGPHTTPILLANLFGKLRWPWGHHILEWRLFHGWICWGSLAAVCHVFAWHGTNRWFAFQAPVAGELKIETDIIE